LPTMKELRRYTAESEASADVALLESEGIPATVQVVQRGMFDEEYYSLRVDESQALEAQGLLVRPHAGDGGGGVARSPGNTPSAGAERAGDQVGENTQQTQNTARQRLSPLHRLPYPLRLVVYVQLISAALTLVGTFGSMHGSSSSENVAGFLAVGFSLLVVVGVFGKSRLVRSLALVLAYLAFLQLSFGFVGALFRLGPGACAMLIPMTFLTVTIWGLQARESLQYFKTRSLNPAQLPTCPRGGLERERLTWEDRRGRRTGRTSGST